MDGKTIGYWASSGLVALAMGASAAGYLSGAMDADMAKLGLPGWFVLTLGTWKGLAAIALLVPALPRVKEWAYAGLFFTFTGAVIAHLASGDPVATAVPPIVLGLITTASYVLRPAHLQPGPSPAPDAPLRAATA
jgi:hypothetical protein